MNDPRHAWSGRRGALVLARSASARRHSDGVADGGPPRCSPSASSRPAAAESGGDDSPGLKRLTHERYHNERDRLAPLPAADPAFRGVGAFQTSSEGVALDGTVPTADDLARLRLLVARAVGERRATTITAGVEISGATGLAAPGR